MVAKRRAENVPIRSRAGGEPTVNGRTWNNLFPGSGMLRKTPRRKTTVVSTRSRSTSVIIAKNIAKNLFERHLKSLLPGQ